MGIFGDLVGPHPRAQSLPPYPITHHLPLSPGLVTSDKESAAHILNRKDGGNLLGIIVGGAQEALNARPGAYKMLLRNRKGFVRLALMHGYLGRGLSVQLETGKGYVLVGRQQRLRKFLFWQGDFSVHSQCRCYFGEICTVSWPNTQKSFQNGDFVMKGPGWKGTYCPKLAPGPRPIGSGRMEFGAYRGAVLLPRSICEESQLGQERFFYKVGR